MSGAKENLRDEELPEIEVVPKAPPAPAAPAPPPEPAREPIPPGAEMAAIAAALQGIHAELKRLNDQMAAIVEPPVNLNHYRKGAALRVDDSHSRVNNPTF